MSERNDGGQAFPQPLSIGPSDDVYPGMTLRDYFAAQALIGILAFPGAVNGNRDKAMGQVVSAAYLYADAMIAERSKP